MRYSPPGALLQAWSKLARTLWRAHPMVRKIRGALWSGGYSLPAALGRVMIEAQPAGCSATPRIRLNQSSGLAGLGPGGSDKRL